MPRNLTFVIIAGAAVVNMVKPGTERTFSEYTADSFIPYIRAQLSHVTRLDIVWDEYLENSLKATTRGKRGSGARQCVAADNKLPWKSFPEVTSAFLSLGNTPPVVDDSCMATLERFVVLLYDRTSAQTAVNGAGKQLFVKKGRQFEAIPPTRAALLEHSKRAVLQAGYIWGKALIPSPTMPNPQNWGWTLDGGLWRPYWTTLPGVMGSCQELVRCGCKKGCRRQCSCMKASYAALLSVSVPMSVTTDKKTFRKLFFVSFLKNLTVQVCKFWSNISSSLFYMDV